MAAIVELTRPYRLETTRYDILGTLQAGWRAMRRHRRERRTMVALSRLSPRLLRDMGFDPDQIYAAVDGTWDEVAPVDHRSHLPRTERV